MTHSYRRGSAIWTARIFLIVLVFPVMSVERARAADKMDCRVYETKSTGLGMGLKFGAMLLPLLGAIGPGVSATPMVNFERKAGVAWDKNVQGLVARYVELCTRYNAGLVTKEEYEMRMQAIEGVHKDMQALESKVFEETRGHAQSAQRDLDQALSKPPKPRTDTTLTESLAALNQRIEQLDAKP
jgi:hypothetical protein